MRICLCGRIADARVETGPPVRQDFAFLRTRMATPGCFYFFDLPLSEQNECWQVVNKVREQLQARCAPDGFTVGLNIGAAAGQKFAHASIHVIPRYMGDVPNPSGGVRNVVRR